MQTEIGDPGRISLNLSLKQLRQASFILRCRSVFRRHGVSPTAFELEITETTLMADTKRTLRLLDELYAMGLHLSIDDFGTGYSSLSALQQFPIDTLKIDQSFVRDVGENAGNATLVRTIIEMGRNLEIDVIAEGVESVQPARIPAPQRLPLRAGQAVRRADEGRGAAGAAAAPGGVGRRLQALHAGFRGHRRPAGLARLTARCSLLPRSACGADRRSSSTPRLAASSAARRWASSAATAAANRLCWR